MEQHPVPQNVTTFQFRLIGDMTLKQFGYLCAGGILALIAYKLPLPLIVTWPLTGLFAFLGIGFAFIPVEERPMDVWVFSFFRSIYSPTQYIWSNDAPTVTPQIAPIVPTTPLHPNSPKNSAPATGAIPSPIPAPPAHPKVVLSGIFQHKTPAQSGGSAQPHTALPSPHHSLIEELTSLFHSRQTAHHQQPHQTQAQASESVSLQQPDAQPTNEPLLHKVTQLEEALRALQDRLANKTITEDRVVELQKQLTEVIRQKSQTDDELIALKRTLPPTETSPTTNKPHGTVNVISSQEAAVRVGLPRLTNSPNVITGIVKDDGGNFLPGILVTVTNHEGVPVRALKTNKLGQFAASTPLTNGVYFIEVEDPRARFTFSRVQLTLTGAVVPVIEIIAKSEKTLTREKLAQELFGGHS